MAKHGATAPCPHGRTSNFQRSLGIASFVSLFVDSVFASGYEVAGRERLRLTSNPWPQSGVTSWLTGMNPLPVEHSPLSKHWSNTIALCAVMKDENTTDILEWLTYYQWLGVDHVFLTDNNSSTGQQQRALLLKHFPHSFLTVRNELEHRGQLKVYAWCAEEQRAHFNWLAFLDVDEYLVIRDTASSERGLKPFLDNYKMFGGLSVHWILVGPSKRKRRPLTGGMLKYYTLCHVDPHPAFKTIANTYYLTGITPHPHNFQFREGVWNVDEDFEEIYQAWHAKPEWQEQGGNNTVCNQTKDADLCYEVPAARHRPAIAEKVALFHYITRSEEDFELKLKRGAGVPNFKRTYDWFDEIQRDERDDPICKEPAALFDKCCAYVPALVASVSGELAVSKNHSQAVTSSTPPSSGLGSLHHRLPGTRPLVRSNERAPGRKEAAGGAVNVSKDDGPSGHEDYDDEDDESEESIIASAKSMFQKEAEARGKNVPTNSASGSVDASVHNSSSESALAGENTDDSAGSTSRDGTVGSRGGRADKVEGIKSKGQEDASKKGDSTEEKGSNAVKKQVMSKVKGYPGIGNQASKNLVSETGAGFQRQSKL